MSDPRDDTVLESGIHRAESSDMHHLHELLGMAGVPDYDKNGSGQLTYHIQVLLIARRKSGTELKLLAVQGQSGRWTFPEQVLHRNELVKTRALKICREAGQTPRKYGLRCRTLDGSSIKYA